MAVQKSRRTPSTRGMRRSHDALSAKQLATDPTTGEITISYKAAQSLDVFRKCVEEGVMDCQQIAEEMKVSKGTVSKMAKKAMDQGWLGKNGREYVLLLGNEG